MREGLTACEREEVARRERRIIFHHSPPPSLPPSVSITVVQTPYGFSLGVGICYDIRFPELAMIMRAKGCTLLLYPGAFNLTTGPAHWELLQRARAVDNQVSSEGGTEGRRRRSM